MRPTARVTLLALAAGGLSQTALAQPIPGQGVGTRDSGRRAAPSLGLQVRRGCNTGFDEGAPETSPHATGCGLPRNAPPINTTLWVLTTWTTRLGCRRSAD